ncbi:hypothetical protein FBU59_000717 [Linderina macrospora]|uniref:Uncharacterized protein n=1 Tax=Linderina macrospora TaxID=4868 RepID=A0ACC1JFZ5_9FUNG|nr:hypothetical protein FBU59_000717 [Linderina macrospora]
MMERLNDFHGAVLLKDGEQTSCEIALISNRGGFVAGSCIDIDENFNAKNISRYSVMLDSGAMPTPGRYPVKGITVHPQYEPPSFGNNLAIVLFNLQSSKLWVNYIDGFPAENTNYLYARRSLNNVSTQSWNSPDSTKDIVVSDGCTKANTLYAANTKDYLCSNKTMTSPVKDLCGVPYSIVYGLVESNMSVTALYSHSATYGNKMCGSTRQFHYYTILSNYLSWANQIVPDSISAFSTNGTTTMSSNLTYAMNEPKNPNVDGVKVSGGNLFARDASVEAWMTVPVPTSTSANALNPVGLLPSKTSTDTDNISGTSKPTSTSKNQIVAIGVSVPLATLVGVALMFFGYKRWKKHHNTVAWDPSNEHNNIQSIALDLGGANTVTDIPPTYDSIREEGDTLTTFITEPKR